MSLNNEYIVNTVARFAFKGKIINPLPMLYYPNLGKLDTSNSKYVKQVEQLRNNSDFILVQQSRQWWKTAPSHITKGNDIFLKGAANFIKANPKVKVSLILFEYGADVEHTKQLIDELDIKSNVHWMPKMLRKELLGIISKADIGVGQFGSESWYLYCSNAEIIASGVTYMGYRDDEYYTKQNCELYPMINANSQEDIANGLSTAWEEKEQIKVRAAEAREWLLQYNQNDFFENIKQALASRESRKLHWNSNLALKMVRLRLAFVRLTNTIVLALKSKWLKSTILEWDKKAF